jgi:hypothetical protein
MHVETRSVITDVVIHVHDKDAIERCFTQEWKDQMYDFHCTDDVLDHWAYSCVANGVEDVSRLDGWADLPPGTATMEARRKFLKPGDRHTLCLTVRSLGSSGATYLSIALARLA